MVHRSLSVAASVLVVFVTSAELLAAGGTSIVARPGRLVTAPEHWPEGVGELVNDTARTTGWNSWFTEWPNDVNHYAFDVSTTAEVNRLIKKLAAIKADLRQIRLSHRQEPESLGWVTRLPDGNKIAVLFSLGDQARIDRWYETVRKPFGTIEFAAAPVAVPPTLTIFVRNEAINLADLEIPVGIDVAAGYVPTLFHRWNRTEEQEQEAQAARRKETLDAPSQEAANAIQAFVKKRS